MILYPVPRQLLPRPFALIFNHNLRSYQTLFSRSQLLPTKCITSSLSRPNIYRTSRALEFHRCYGYSTATFNANKSRFPTHRELYSKNPPSNELIRYMRRWEEELRSDAKESLPLWTPQQRDVMMAACIEFRLVYNPDKLGSRHRLEQTLMAWKKGLQADSQSRQPRWNAAYRRRAEKVIAIEEKNMKTHAAAQKKKEDDEWKAKYGGFWGKVRRVAEVLAFFAFMGFLNIILNIVWICLARVVTNLASLYSVNS